LSSEIGDENGEDIGNGGNRIREKEKGKKIRLQSALYGDMSRWILRAIMDHETDCMYTHDVTDTAPIVRIFIDDPETTEIYAQ